ncbi:hydroxymethylbilane synthase, partial [Serratia bockelmannii]|uniref:hydroxymethylbilane synthase n=1 Tax=Serratia bockelmannii TaxID=2703793 RepID=UPI003CFD5E3E
EVTGRAVELVEITTYGDTSREHLAQIGGTGVFVAALREALLRGEVDFAVHSLKDQPTSQPDDLVLAAVPVREDPRDVIVARDGLTFEQLPDGARIGTGSPRRMAQLNAYARSHGLRIETVPIRGNVDTRIGFVRDGKLDAVVLAAAGLSRLGRTGEVTDFLTRNFEVPSQNLIYADTEGNIGYQAPGKIPVRSAGFDGTAPAPGWDPKYAWKGYIPFDELPYEYNPDRGYIVTANQAVIDEKKYPYLLTKDWGYGARSQRINDLLAQKIKGGEKVSTDDMQKLQMDNFSEIAALLVPELKKINIPDPSVREAQKLLDGWDYTQESDSAAAAYFNGVWRNIL